VKYDSPQLKALLEKIRAVEFEVGGNGSILLPPELESADIRLGRGKYRIGIGGLHSSETKVMHRGGDDLLIVTGYYSAIILNQGLPSGGGVSSDQTARERVSFSLW